MAEHEVALSIPHEIEIGNTDVLFRITADGESLGTVRISRGTIDFIRRGARTRFQLPWGRFAELMEEHGRKNMRAAIPRAGRRPRPRPR